MKKEQLLLVGCVVVGGLVVWANGGTYEPVGADRIGEGVDVEVRETIPADPLLGPDPNAPGGRSIVRQTRVEKRLPRPVIAAPDPLGLPWIRPIPYPQVPPHLWRALRDPMTAAAKPADTKEEKPPEEEEEDLDPEEKARRDAAKEKETEEKARLERLASSAKLVHKNGDAKPVRLTPADAGQPVWVILEKWPNVRFFVEEFNPDMKTVIGRYEIGADQIERSYETVRLERTLENEYHEQRIKLRVRENDREGNIQFADWIRNNLAPKWGVPAVRLALQHLLAAKAIQMDPGLIAKIGDTAQEAYDLDAEIRAYLEYLQGARANETSVIVRLGDAYQRAGAHRAAQEQFENAANLGDVVGRLRYAQSLLASATTEAELVAADTEFQKCTSSNVRARALSGLATVRLRQGNLADAVKLGADARAADGSSFEAAAAHGTALYASGKFAEAEQAFSAASVLEPAPDRGGGTRGRSNRAMALVAADRLPEAVAEAERCLQEDALNYFDPLVVLGEVQQRWGELTRSNDTFQTALQRQPRNPWILLRLASIRLRDGLPTQALALVQGADGVPGILQLVPESVDALRVAGLACAAQETPDWAGAVKFLRRALEKEPQNTDLVYELARSLILAGRADEAIGLLERATESTTGVARNDARVLSLLAYAHFTAGKSVQEFFQLVQRALGHNPGEATKKYLEDVRKVVDEWNRMRVWQDEFKGPKTDIRNGWTERESWGVAINCDGETCIFNGDQRSVPTERKEQTGITRQEELAPLQEISFVLKPESTGFEFVAHLYVGELQSLNAAPTPGRKSANVSELGLGRDRQGKMRLFVNSANTKMFNVTLKDESGAERDWPEDGQFHRITFRRLAGDVAKGQFEILFDGVKVETPAPIELGQLSAQFNRKAELGVHVDADQGARVRLVLDLVEVVRMTGPRR